MEDSVVTKLRALLSHQLNSECEVVYLLCECRKLLEKYWHGGAIPFALRLYFHWALHIDLDRRGTTLPFLQRVDAYAKSVLAGTTDFSLEQQMVEDFVFLETFRAHFRQFLNAYNLPTAICDDEESWHRFMENYAGVIQDGSISCQGEAAELAHVRKVTFTKCKPTDPNTYLPFGLSWTIELADGRNLAVDVWAAPLADCNRLVASTVRLH